MRQLLRPLSISALVLALQIIGFAQSVGLSVGSGSGAAGATVSLPINLTSLNGAQTAGLQWSFQFSPDITSVTVSPGPAATNAGKSLQCSTNTCLLFSLDTATINDGTIAMASFQIATNPSSASISVQVTGVAAATTAGDSIPAAGGSGTITVLAPPPTVSVGINPQTASLTALQSQQFTAAVTGSSNTSVTWSMTPSVGTLSNGLYTAPSVINTAQSVTITATSLADPTKSASATVQLTPIVSVSINPLTATLSASQIQQFTATVTGSSNASVTWSMTPTVGTLSNGLYTAPAALHNAQSVTITATSVADPTKSAGAVIQLKPKNSKTTLTSQALLGASQSNPRFTVQNSVRTSTTAAVRERTDNGLPVLSAASLTPGPAAPDSLVTVFGDQFASTPESAVEQPLPAALGGCTVTITDANGQERAAGLYFVSPNQINFKIPTDTATGKATIKATCANPSPTFGELIIATVAPGLFFLNSGGLAAADLTRVKGNIASYENVAQIDDTTGLLVAAPIDLGPDSDEVFLTLYGTGFRHHSGLDAVQVLVANMPVPVDYAGTSINAGGVDLVRVLLPKGLRVTGIANVVVTVDGVSSNTVSMVIK